MTSDDLSVFADSLIAKGDPRGDVLAERLARGETELVGRYVRAELEAYSPDLGIFHHGNTAWFETPDAEYLRTIKVLDRAENVIAFMKRVLEKPRYLLRRLWLQPGFAPITFDRRAAEMMPNLRELELVGGADLRAFRHRTLTRLTRSVYSLEGGDTLEWSFDLPAVTELALGLYPWKKAWREKRVQLGGLPALETLDLSASDPDSWGMRKDFTRLEIHAWAGELEILGRLRRLVLPAVRSARDMKAVVAIRTAHPTLAIELAQNYSRYQFPLPRDVMLAEPWPFPPDDETNHPENYTFVAGRYDFQAHRSTLAWVSRRDWNSGEPFQTATRELWAVLDAVDRTGRGTASFGVIRRAIAEWKPGDLLETSETLRRAVLNLAPNISDDQVVSIKAVAGKRR